MNKSFLDQVGLAYLWGKIKEYVASYSSLTTNSGTVTVNIGGNSSVVPTKTSQMTNDSGFITSADIPEGAAASTTTPLMDGTAAVGTETAFARGDHRHPSDTSKQDVIDASHKLSADLVEDGTTNKAYTAAEKDKLATVAQNAEVNQNAFSNIKVGITTVAANTKTDTVEFVAGSNITLTPDATSDKITIAAASVTPASAAPLMDGTATVGTSAKYAREDHKHPSDTSKQDVISDLATIRSGAAAGATAYQKPSTGIPATDLASAVQTSLEKADTALQSSALDTYAPKASPALTGTPTAPTATAGTNTTQIATTAFVTAAVSAASAGVASFQGTVSAASTITGAAYKKGWYWVVGTAGTYVGQVCEAGDMIFAIKDKGSAYAAGDFSVVQNNMDIQEMTTAEMDTVTNNWT